MSPGVWGVFRTIASLLIVRMEVETVHLSQWKVRHFLSFAGLGVQQIQNADAILVGGESEGRPIVGEFDRFDVPGNVSR